MTGPVADAALVPPLQHRVARVLLAAFVALHAVLALASTGPAPIPMLALVLLSAAAAAVVLLPRRLPAPATAAVVVAALLAAGLVLTTLSVGGWPGYAAWPLGASTFVALALTLRGRIGIAWLLLGGLALECVAWSLLAGAGPLPGVDLVVRHAGTLLIGTLFAVGLRRSAVSLAAYREAEREREAQRVATTTAGTEQRRAAQRFLDLAGAALTDLGAGRPVDPPQLLALEGRLRDEMTAGPLLTDRLNAALAATRAAGMDAVVLEDAHLAAPTRELVADWLAERLDRDHRGRFVARVVRSADGIRVSARSDGFADELELPAS
ncbi:hypothetical protein [Amnibacterium endophyticum]|uniref:Uncharacterized protein n=1 Tax=Amnibacterium endophyticum TaxID=2109337 RepID=A0ABW4LA39_9MICO